MADGVVKGAVGEMVVVDSVGRELFVGEEGGGGLVVVEVHGDVGGGEDDVVVRSSCRVALIRGTCSRFSIIRFECCPLLKDQR